VVLVCGALSMTMRSLVLLALLWSSRIRGRFQLASEFVEFLLIWTLFGLSVFCHFLIFLCGLLESVLSNFSSVFQILFTFLKLFLSFFVDKFAFLQVFLLFDPHVLSGNLMHNFQGTLRLSWWHVRCAARLPTKFKQGLWLSRQKNRVLIREIVE
jgi:hypothetical protein